MAAGSNVGVISTGDNARITVNQRQPKQRRPARVVYGEIPRQPPAFQPREDLRRQVLNAGRLAVISTLAGARGIGKSQLAAAYARQCIDDGWPLVAWIGAERADQVLADLDQLCGVMGLRDDADDSASAARKVRRWLEGSASRRCLVVFDNATDPDAVADWLPSAGHARIVITSNRRSFGDLGTLIEVEPYTAGEARAYLSERTGLGDESGADSLAEELGRLPLALAQAAAVIQAQRLTYTEFVERVRRLPLEKYLARQAGDTYPRGAAETVLLAVEQAERGSKLSRALMQLISVLSPDGIARDLIQSAPIGRGTWPWLLGAGHTISKEHLDEAVEQLASASLVTVSVDGQAVLMHRFTQRVIRERAQRQGIYPLLLMRVSRVVGSATNNPATPGGARNREDLIQQVSALWDNVGIASARDIDYIMKGAGPLGRRPSRKFAKSLIELRNWSVSQLTGAGNPARAIQLGVSVTRECEALLGRDDPNILTSRNNLAGAYRAAGRIDEAVELHQRTLADHERILGPDHPHTLASRNNLAAAYHDAGRIDQAIELHQRTLADHERILGPDHPDTLTSRNNLAGAYHDAGRIEEAVELHQRTLADRERVLGPDHPDTLTSRNWLAAAKQRRTERRSTGYPPRQRRR